MTCIKNRCVLLVLVTTAVTGSLYADETFPTYEASWTSLNKHEIPKWLLDAKLGLYGHWGVYSVPAFRTEWYGRLMYDKGTRGSAVFDHHVETFGKQSEFGYKDFIKDFKAEKFDPDEWADLIVRSGARYAGLTVVHHDGFCLWNSKLTRWDVKDTGPKRDLYGELVASLRKADPKMKILSCFHHFRTYGWFYTNDRALRDQGRKEGWDIFDPKYVDFYWNPSIVSRSKFLEDWQGKIKEVVDKYAPDVVWFDGGPYRKTAERLTLETLAYIYNSQKKKGTPVEVFNKKTNFHPDFGLRNFEKGAYRPAKTDYHWNDDLNIANKGWGYTHDLKYRTPNQIIDGFVDRVSRGGGLLLSISPKPDGTIPREPKDILLAMGNWLKVNGEGIYGTRKWKIETEGPVAKLLYKASAKKTLWNFKDTCDAGDVRYTRKGNRLFAFILDWPEDNKAVLRSLRTGTKVSTRGITGMKMLGCEGDLKWSRDANSLLVELPSRKPCDYAYGLEIVVDGELVD